MERFTEPVFVIIFACLIFAHVIFSKNENDTNLCKTSCHSSVNGSYLVEFCNSHDFKIDGRCCMNMTNGTEIVGINLKDCDIVNMTGMFANMGSLEVLMLEDNKLDNASDGIFQGLVHLEYLSLPLDIECPGGWQAWQNTSVTHNVTICINETDFCHALNVTCPTNSFCQNSGPGMTQCLCLPGYHGYKCLRKGTFPTVIFSAGLGGITVFISALMWITQRRHAKVA